MQISCGDLVQTVADLCFDCGIGPSRNIALDGAAQIEINNLIDQFVVKKTKQKCECEVGPNAGSGTAT